MVSSTREDDVLPTAIFCAPKVRTSGVPMGSRVAAVARNDGVRKRMQRRKAFGDVAEYLHADMEVI